MSDAQKRLDEYEAKPTAELIENAEQLIYAMCKDGSAKHWLMSIPVSPDDSDIILLAALRSAKQRIADLERHNELLRAALEASVENTDKILNYLVTRNLPAAMEVSNLIKTVELQAAIDGGALEVE